VAPSGAASAAANDARALLDTLPDRLPTPSIALGTVVARMDPVATKLDQLRAAASGPYTVNGTTVYSSAQFRMSKGFNDDAVSDPAVQATLTRAAARAGVTRDLPLIKVGRGSPEALVKLTQALIDDQQLPAISGKPLADQIHDLQWRLGIGMDCAGYVYRAVTAVSGDPAKLGLKPTENENFTGLPRNPHFQKVGLAQARAGDVLVLAGTGEVHDPGHNLVVRSHANASEGSAAAQWPTAAPLLKGMGPVQVYEVDSSFGATAAGRADGGVRRDVLLYSATTDTWLTIKSTMPTTAQSGAVPYGELALTGFFRPKGAP
jgi:hypothetical protein